jgi:hypothetical protein
MELGTKNRAETNGGHLQAASLGKIPRSAGVSGRIHFGVCGARENCDVTRWDRFADIKDIKKEMRERLETLVFLQILAD